MKLPEFSVKRRVTITMVFVAILIFGILCMKRLKLDMAPENNPTCHQRHHFLPGGQRLGRGVECHQIPGR